MKTIFCMLLILALLLQLAIPVVATEADPSPPETEALTEPVPTEPIETTEATEPDVTEETDMPMHRPDEMHKPYITGKNDGGFHPQEPLTRAELAVILYSQGSYSPGEAHFSDVRSGSWYAAAVNALAGARILAGYSDGTFRPNKPINRGQFVAILAKISGETAALPATFSDVGSHWAAQAIALAQEKGWVSGYSDGTFRPQSSVTRAEAVVMLNKFLRRSPDHAAIAASEGLRFFPDVKIGSWYYAAVMEAATIHTAQFQSDDQAETWFDPSPGNYRIRDGFYCFGKKLFAVEGGAYVRTAETRILNGVIYTCEGESGVCRAQTEILTLANRDLALLTGGAPVAAPGRYTDGFYLKAGHLFAAKNGSILHAKVAGTADGVSYTCTGESGYCTVDDWTKLNLDGINLSVFENELTEDALYTDSQTVTVAQALRAAVRVYEAYFRVEYPMTDEEDEAWIEKALEYDILKNRRNDYDQPVKRGDAAVFLQRSLRGRDLEAMNEINVLPDVSETNFYHPYLLCLYRAGVMQGIDDDHNANYNDTILAGELADMLQRLERPDKRLRFTVNEKIIQTIQYGTSGSGRYPLTAYQLGNGKNVMILTFAIHGWEDNWNRDGEELVYLAEQTKRYLENNYELIQNGHWTVYILRCLNPDGLYLGTTSNGPGRCTTTYYNSNGQLISGKGIDMNRCFPYKFTARTDARNFNGTEPLQCKEAQAIASFIQKCKGSGHNICIDTHGWYGQIICSSGKGSIYNAFSSQFPRSTYTYLSGGSGYLTGWAGFVQGYDSCLLELPNVQNHNAFLNAGCVWRYENAISELLKHYSGPNATRSSVEYPVELLNGN